MRAADLDDYAELLRPLAQCFVQVTQRWTQLKDEAFKGCNMNCRGNDIVAGLPVVNVVVGMHQFVALPTAEQFRRSICDHLVGVHIRGGAGTGLKNVHHELRVEFAINNFLSSRLDGVSSLWREQT